MKIILSDCHVECLRSIKRWNLGVQGCTPGTSPPCPTRLQIIGAIPRDLVEIELFGRFPREQVQRELAELELNGLIKNAVLLRGPYDQMHFMTLDGAHAEIEISEPDGHGKRRVFLRRPPLSIRRHMEEEVLGYALEPHGVEALTDFEEALKTGKQVLKHHYFPEIKTPIARFMDVAHMAFVQDLSGSTYSDGRPAYSGIGPLRNWGDVQRAYEEAKAYVLELPNAQIVEAALDECFYAIRASADAQDGGRPTDQLLSLSGKYITAHGRLRGYVRVMPQTPASPSESQTPSTKPVKGPPKAKESVLHLKQRAEEWVKAHGGFFGGLTRLAEDLNCAKSSLSKAIKMSTYLKAREAEHKERRKVGRTQSLDDVTLDNKPQEREENPQSVLNDLIEEQRADDATDNRRKPRTRRSHDGS